MSLSTDEYNQNVKKVVRWLDTVAEIAEPDDLARRGSVYRDMIVSLVFTHTGDDWHRQRLLDHIANDYNIKPPELVKCEEEIPF